MTPTQLSDAVLGALDGLVRRGEVDLSGELPAAVVVERTVGRSGGDYAVGTPLELAARTGLTARGLAGLLARELADVPGIAFATAAGAGFVNVRLTEAAELRQLATIVSAGASWDATPGAEEVRGTVAARLARAVTEHGPECVRAVGVEALRYGVARTPPGTPSGADLDLLTRADESNPAYKVAYVATRCRALLRDGADLGVDPAGVDARPAATLDSALGRGLVRLLADHPRHVDAAARLREPQRVTRFLEAVADGFLGFHGSCRVLPQGEEEVTEVHRARLLLVDATGLVLRNGLDLLGVSVAARI